MTHFAASKVIQPVSVLSKFLHGAATLPLSQELRAKTEMAHKEVEERLALPGSIRSLLDYQACLSRFYQLYKPMEIYLQRFPEWPLMGLDTSSFSLSGLLANDLLALNTSLAGLTDAPAEFLPPLQDLASALGARYVLEGSALGSQFMLPQLQQTLGEQINGADSFFRGRGDETAAFWKQFRAALDLYGRTHPEQTSDVVSAANATFEAIGLWMTS